MASIDVTPQELRDIEIREAWRGYHRDDVDELLERAATTIEHLQDENRQLKARLQQGPAPAAAQPAPAPAPQPRPQPAPAQSLPPVRTSETDVIQRTLVLAQKAADEAVAEARAKAQQMLAESESKAEQLVAEAEETARRIADKERGKLEQEIARLSETRETLSADVDALERFDRDYRERLRVAIEAELELLRSTTGHGAGERPVLHEVDIAISRPVGTWTASQEGFGTAEAAAPTSPAAPAPAAPAPAAPAAASSAHIEGVQAYPQTDDSGSWAASQETAGWETPAPAPERERDSTDHDAALAELNDTDDTGQHESLDDDAFFASLRDAVRDDPSLSSDDDQTDFFDSEAGADDDAEEDRRLFRRRR